MKDIDLSGIENYVSETIADLSGIPDKSYQTKGLYQGTLATLRAINVLLCALLVGLFVLAGGA